MKSDRWPRLRPLLDRALELDADARRAYVLSLDGEDAELRDELERLLVEHESIASRTMPNAMELAVPAVADRLHEDAELDLARIGQSIGPYRLVRLLGAGGMGAVYLAERSEQGFTHEVALKVVRKALGSQSARDRFERERQILANLKHPGIALLFDGGQTSEGHSYYTMEYVDGETITEHCAHGAESVEARLRLLIQVAETLAYAHQNLIVHRDIKPSNVLVTADARVKLVDFGLAKLIDEHAMPSVTQTGLGPMTPIYAAPEQFLNKPTTVATDIYQFGALCFHVLTGCFPYRADPNDSLEWARAVVDDEPTRMTRASQQPAAVPELGRATMPPGLGRGIWRDLDAIVRKCLRKVPEQRYRSADALISDLRAVLTSRPVSARRAGPLYFAWRFVQRHPYAIATTVLAVSALAIVGMIALSQTFSAAEHAERAAREAEIRDVTREMLTDLLRVGPASGVASMPRSALEALDQGAKRTLDAVGSNPRHRAMAVAVLARSYVDSRHPQRARDLIQREMPSLSGLEGPDLIDINMILARATAELGEIDTSQRAAATAERIMDDIGVPPHSPQRLADAIVHVHLEKHAGKLIGAKEMAARLMSEFDLPGINETVEFRDLIVTYVSMFDTEDEDSSVDLFERAKRISTKHYGPDSPITLTDERSAISSDMEGSQKLDATRLLESQETRVRQAFGDQSIDYADVLVLKCERAFLIQDFAASASCWTKVLGIYEQVPDADYLIAIACDNVASSYMKLGQPAKALPYYERERVARSKNYPPNDRNVAHARLQIATTRCLLGDFDWATREWDDAMDDFVAAVGPLHPWEAFYAARLATCLLDGGRIESARSIMEKHGKLDPPRKDMSEADRKVVAAVWERLSQSH